MNTTEKDILKLEYGKNLLYCKYPEEKEVYREFNDNGKVTRYKDSTGHEELYEYDDAGNCIHFKSSDNCVIKFEEWSKYDENGNRIYYKNSNGWEVKR